MAGKSSAKEDAVAIDNLELLSEHLGRQWSIVTIVIIVGCIVVMLQGPEWDRRVVSELLFFVVKISSGSPLKYWSVLLSKLFSVLLYPIS